LGGAVLHCSALRHIALLFFALRCVVLHCAALRCTALHCAALRCTALHCAALLCAVPSFFTKLIPPLMSHSLTSETQNKLIFLPNNSIRHHHHHHHHTTVLLTDDPGKDDVNVNEMVFSIAMRALGISRDDIEKFRITMDVVTVVKKSFDGRWKKDGQPKFVYTCELGRMGVVLRLHCLRVAFAFS
jgi:hypothetical protein